VKTNKDSVICSIRLSIALNSNTDPRDPRDPHGTAQCYLPRDRGECNPT